MAEWPERQRILQDGATRREIAIADTDGRLDDIDMALVRQIKDVDAAPEWALPYLAWERSVDVWRPDWPLDTKRAVIKAAPIVHRYKGTVYAVRTAVAALGVKATLTEWWQVSPGAEMGAPYTFDVLALANARPPGGGPLITPEVTRDVLAAIRGAKPVSRAFTFRIGASLTTGLGTAATAAAVMTATPSGTAAPPTGLGADLGAAALAGAVQVFNPPGVSAAPPTVPAVRFAAAAAVRALAVVTLRLEARPPL